MRNKNSNGGFAANQNVLKDVKAGLNDSYINQLKMLDKNGNLRLSHSKKRSARKPRTSQMRDRHNSSTEGDD